MKNSLIWHGLILNALLPPQNSTGSKRVQPAVGPGHELLAPLLHRSPTSDKRDEQKHKHLNLVGLPTPPTLKATPLITISCAGVAHHCGANLHMQLPQLHMSHNF